MPQQRTRKVDSIQRITSSIKNFERKLDKLQNDVKYQGQTLSNLRILVVNLTTGTVACPDEKSVQDQTQKRTMAIQYDEIEAGAQKTPKIKKTSKRCMGSKLKVKSLTNQNNESLSNKFSINSRAHKAKINDIHAQRHKKADAFRKVIPVKALKKTATKIKPIP